jgi:hypothetical protein
LAFLFALAIYAVFYSGIEHRRVRKGPWQVTFTNTPASAPALLINQPFLCITNVQIIFPDDALSSTNVGGSFTFAQPRQVPYPISFARCVFMDTTFLPGTLTLQAFGHEIELLPRVLVADLKEYAWRSGMAIELPRTGESNR